MSTDSRLSSSHRRWSALAVVLMLVVPACSSTGETESTQAAADETRAEETAAEEATVSTEQEQPSSTPAELELLDERTVVVPAGTDIYDDGATAPTPATPSLDAVAAVLAAVDALPELAWAAEHARFVSATTAEGDPLNVHFSCAAPALTSGEQALTELRRAINVMGGGDCYGSALFEADGTLLRWRTNGES